MVSSLGSTKYLNPIPPPDLIMSSSDGRYRVHVGHIQLEFLLDTCRESGSLETGGLVVGRYNETHDTAIVTHIWGPPTDSVRGPTSFYRGTHGLQARLNSLWSTKEYYLGEWHYHPNGGGQPSIRDERQMIRIAESLRYNTPEPLLLVVGGSRWNVVCYVFPRQGSPVRMTPLATNILQDARVRDVCVGPVKP